MAETAGKGSNEKDTSKAASQMSPPSITPSKGGGAIDDRGEKFAANPVTGMGSMTVPIATSPGHNAWPDPGKSGSVRGSSQSKLPPFRRRGLPIDPSPRSWVLCGSVNKAFY